MSAADNALRATRERWPAENHPWFNHDDVLDPGIRSVHIDAARERRALALNLSGWRETDRSEREVNLIRALSAVSP